MEKERLNERTAMELEDTTIKHMHIIIVAFLATHGALGPGNLTGVKLEGRNDRDVHRKAGIWCFVLTLMEGPYYTTQTPSLSIMFGTGEMGETVSTGGGWESGAGLCKRAVPFGSVANFCTDCQHVDTDQGPLTGPCP